ncbi:hypothetical protein GEM_0337 [Burkholderia cepacia GG4]|uniref:Uncharacterized protein n=1 Tax=Burkholderia cepacia GG4 TaxID=1009846 RepID=A0A9W3JXW1_BURCE|nr:hypothetical protein GEM_0337 [Burkholderia cepacia GG4]
MRLSNSRPVRPRARCHRRVAVRRRRLVPSTPMALPHRRAARNAGHAGRCVNEKKRNDWGSPDHLDLFQVSEDEPVLAILKLDKFEFLRLPGGRHGARTKYGDLSTRVIRIACGVFDESGWRTGRTHAIGRACFQPIGAATAKRMVCGADRASAGFVRARMDGCRATVCVRQPSEGRGTHPAAPRQRSGARGTRAGSPFLTGT